MGHSSRKIVYEVYGNYVDGLEKDAGQISDYFGKDFIGLQNRTTSTFATLTGESRRSVMHNPLHSIIKQWWRRRELNPRPKAFGSGFYMLIPGFDFHL